MVPFGGIDAGWKPGDSKIGEKSSLLSDDSAASSSFFFLVWNPQASAPITSLAGTHTDGGAVIRKPGSAWLEGTPAMDLGHMNVVLK